MRRTLAVIVQWLRLARIAGRRLVSQIGLSNLTFPTALLLTVLLALVASRWFDETFSVVEAAVVLFLALLVLGAWGDRSRTRILPFRNLTGGEAKEKYDAISKALADLLELEIRRINELESGALTEGSPLNVPAVARGDRPGKSPLRSLATASEAGGDVLAEVGTISLGALSVPLGSFLGLMLPAKRVISGTVRHLDGALTIVAEYTGKPRQKWLVEGEGSPDSSEIEIRKLVRRLAYQMVLSVRAAHIDPAAYRHYIEGLEHYESYSRNGSIADLDEAERRFSRAAAISPTFASAYYNLGVTHEMRTYMIQALEGKPAPGQLLQKAIAMYQRTLELEPERSDARLQLGRIAYEHGVFEEAVEKCREAVEIAERSGQSTASARYWLAESFAAQARVVRRTEDSEGAIIKGYEDALVEYRRARRDLIALRRERRLSGRKDDIGLIEGELTEVALGLGRAEHELSRMLPATPATKHVRRATKVLRSATKVLRSETRVEPSRSQVHALLGRILSTAETRRLSTRNPIHAAFRRVLGPGNDTDAWGELIEAFRIDPGNHDAVLMLVELLREGKDSEGAAHALRAAVEISPDDPNTWIELANHATLDGFGDDAISLAGVALSLEPWNKNVLTELADLYSVRRADSGRSAQDRTAASTYRLLADVLPELDDPLAWLKQQVGAAAIWADQTVRRQLRVHQWVLGWLLARDPDRSGEAPRWLEAAGASEPLSEARLAHHELGGVYQRSGHPDKAVNEFEKAVQITVPVLGGPPLAWWVDLGDACAALSPEFADKAIDAYTKAVDFEVPPIRLSTGARSAIVLGETFGLTSRARALAGRAALYYETGRRAEALSDCIDAIRIQPEYAYPRLTLADLSREEADYDRALREWTTIAALTNWRWVVEHGTGDIWYERAQLTDDPVRRSNFLQRALDAYCAALSERLQPEEEVPIRSSRAEVLTDLGRVAEALKEREYALLIAKDLPEADDLRFKLAVAYDNAKRFADAEREYRKCLEVRQRSYNAAPENAERADAGIELADVENDLAYLYADQGIDLEEARRLVDDATARVRIDDPSGLWGEILDTRGWIRYQQGNLDGAIEDLREAIRVKRGQEASLQRQHLALVYEARAANSNQETDRARDLGLARREWERIIELDPDGSSGKVAQIHLRTAEKSEAVHICRSNAAGDGRRRDCHPKKENEGPL